MTPRVRHNLTFENDDLVGRVYHVTTVPSHRLPNRKRVSTIGLTDCVSTMPDGSTRIVRKLNNKLTTTPVESARVVQVNNKRTLLGPITTYIEVAERVGLNAARVAELYRYRRDNGYSLSTDVAIETNATFRGGDH